MTGASAGLSYGASVLVLIGPVWHWLALVRTGHMAWQGHALAAFGYAIGGAGISLAAASWPASAAVDPARLRMIRARVAPTLGLAIALGAQLLAQWSVRRSRVITAVILLTIITASLLRLWGRVLPSVLAGFTRCWLAGSVTLTSQLILDRLMPDTEPVYRLGAALAVLLCAAAVSWLSERARRGRPELDARLAVLGSLALLAGGVVAYVFTETGVLRAQLPAASVADKRQPNVVLISLDTVRADHLPLYGYSRATTPVLNELARTSITFERAFSASNMTLSTHASIWTGLWVRDHGARYVPEPQPLPERFPTLAQTLHGRGYRCAAVVSNFGFLRRDWGMSGGFDYYDDRAAAPLLGETEPFLLSSMVRSLLAPFTTRRQRELVYRDAAQITDDAIDAVDAVRESGRPLYLFLNYMDAHSPYLPPAPFDTRFPGKQADFTNEHEERIEREVMQGKRSISAEERSHIISQYDAGLTFADSQLGRLFATLRARGLWDNTLVIVTSDHGEAFGERDIVGHGSALYDDQIRVPLVIRPPRGTTASRSTALASSVDLLPTVRAAIGLPPDPKLPGLDLLGATQAPRVIFSESYPNPYLRERNARFRANLFAAIAWPYKITASDERRIEAADLEQDPSELKALDPGSAQLQAVREALEAWRAHTASSQARAVPKAPAADVRARLRALGYVK
ncbi:MAG TPA: sulfatase [Polyangiales bacterium]